MADGPQLRPLRPGEGGHGGEGGCGEGTALPAALARTAGWGGVGGTTVFWGVLGAIRPLLKPARHGSSAKRRPARKCVPAAAPSVSMATAGARPAHSNGAGPARRHGGRRQPRRLSAGGQRADRERAGEHGRREGRGGWPAAPRGAGSPVPRDIARPGPQQHGAGNAALLRFSVP